MDTWVPALIAIAAAFLIAMGTVLRQRASRSDGTITPDWWLGAAVAVIGFGLQAFALAIGSILLVQPLIVFAVVFALPLEARIDHRKPSNADWLWAVILVACVTLFLVVSDPADSGNPPSHALLGLTVTGLIIGIILLVVAAERLKSLHYRALLYGIAAGALFGIAALLIKTVAIQVKDSVTEVLAHPDVYLLAIVVLLAIIAQQRAFGAGDIQTSFPAMNVAEPAVAMLLGVVVLGETLQVKLPTGIFLVAVMLLAMVAVAKLAQDAAVRGESTAAAGDESTAP